MTRSLTARVLRGACISWIACLAAWAAACGSEPAPKPAAVRRVPSIAPRAHVAKAKRPVLLDPAGNLLPSGARIGWLELPRGLVELQNAPRSMRMYRAQGIALDLVQAFFGARLLPTRIETLGAGGVRFAESVPLSGAQKGVVRMDVSVTPGAEGLVNVTIEERPTLPASPTLKVTEARALLREEAKRAE